MTVNRFSGTSGVITYPNIVTSVGAVGLTPTGVTAGSYSSPTVTVDGNGRLTSASTTVNPGAVNSISFNGGTAQTGNVVLTQANADWNATSGVAQVLNKPTFVTTPAYDWNATSGVNQILNKPALSNVSYFAQYTGASGSGTPNTEFTVNYAASPFAGSLPAGVVFSNGVFSVLNGYPARWVLVASNLVLNLTAATTGSSNATGFFVTNVFKNSSNNYVASRALRASIPVNLNLTIALSMVTLQYVNQTSQFATHASTTVYNGSLLQRATVDSSSTIAFAILGANV